MLLGRAVQQNIHVGRYVHVAQLQRPRERKNQRDVFLLGLSLVYDFDMRRRPGGQSAGEGCIGVHVKLEEVEEGVRNHGDCAIFFFFDSVPEF